ncbi:MAG: DUF3458 domain-containing protein, partial [Sphingomonadaceae bacterium]
PESYMEIGNFYTATIYNKGAEVIRMMHTILGASKFRAGSDLYFARHDGQAVTCEDFVLAMEEASGVDLTTFRLWYAQAGTPKLRAELDHDPATATATVRLAQQIPDTPGQSNKAPMPIPLKLTLFDAASGASSGEQLLIFDKVSDTITFPGHNTRPILSINRDFSAPVIVETNRTIADLAFLAQHDDDRFARYEAMQQLMLDTLVSAVSGGVANHDAVIAAVRDTIAEAGLEPAFVAEATLLPSEAFIGDQMLVVDPPAINRAREALRVAIGTTLLPQWRSLYAQHTAGAYVYSPGAKGARRLRNVALGYISGSGARDAGALAFAQFEATDNMTDRLAALGTLANGDAAERPIALAAFYDRYRTNALVIDKWFSTQAFSSRADTVAAVRALEAHPDFALTNPNRVRALVGAFSGNQNAFHDASGEGYRFLADTIIALDPINPQTAAKLTPPLGRWRRFDEGRQALMKRELERIIATPGLSKDVFEQASKSLA